jgi:hypothetical protein
LKEKSLLPVSVCFVQKLDFHAIFAVQKKIGRKIHIEHEVIFFKKDKIAYRWGGW